MSANNQHNLQDQLLVGKVLAGDRDAFALIVGNTEKLVAQIIHKMINHPEDRKDIVQEVYLKAFRSLSRFRFESKLSTWIARIAYNGCLNHLSKKQPLSLDAINQPEPSVGNGADQIMFRKEAAAILAAAIERLPPVFKTLITLYHNEGMNYAEIQQITTLPEGTIKSYLFRARKALKEDLLLHHKKGEL